VGGAVAGFTTTGGVVAAVTGGVDTRTDVGAGDEEALEPRSASGVGCWRMRASSSTRRVFSLRSSAFSSISLLI
jgi:hypothetical protein